MREIINAIFYVLRAGCPWQMVPDCFPSTSTLISWFMRLRDASAFAVVLRRTQTQDHAVEFKRVKRQVLERGLRVAPVPREYPAFPFVSPFRGLGLDEAIHQRGGVERGAER
jgi:hypothetical protein